MQAGRLRWLSVAIGVMTLAGCKRGRPEAVEIRRPPPVQPSVSLPPLPPPLVFYDETGEPSKRTPALSDAELRKTLGLIAARTPDRVWLIWVRPVPRTGARGALTAYLVPDEMTPEIRVGRAYDIRELTGQTEVRSPWKYVQVSVPDHGFTMELTKPPVAEMPFRWPIVVDANCPMSKDEVIAVVNFVRQPSSYRESIARAAPPEGPVLREPYKQPIFQIRGTGNRIDVWFGFLHAPLWGYGCRVRVERGSGGYRITSCGIWMS